MVEAVKWAVKLDPRKWGEEDRLPRCKDYDDECPEVPCKLSCWLYDPARGFCPWLSNSKLSEGNNERI